MHAASASYQVRDENIDTTFKLPVVRMSLPTLDSSHWSQAKQDALAQQLLDTAKALEAKGVTTIHLLLACQNSVAFNLGRRLRQAQPARRRRLSARGEQREEVSLGCSHARRQRCGAVDCQEIWTTRPSFQSRPCSAG
ncbi:SAVED domain-containing protein [Rhizobium leguminosarum]|uniref:SAVED domain-containing protein n=1 Tax=Rhizobium leguminosarum TaxID=384 RepID=A0A6P0DND5_RHILE|nr:SAVED domain-containing protein [Rhizobium leguminosarum]